MPRIHIRIVYLLSALGVLGNPAWADESTPAHPEAAEPLPSTVDLRREFEQWGLSPRNQGSRPTCSVFTIAGALEFALARRQNRGERLSVEFLNWAANQTRRGNRDGGFFSDMWRGFAAHGICPEAQMPYQPEFDGARTPDAEVVEKAKSRLALDLQLHWIKRWNVNTGLSGEEFLAIKRTLHRGWPVCSGLRWPHREVWKSDVLQMCPPEGVFDGHSVLLVGYRDDPEQAGGGVFIFRNTNHGGRDGFMPYAYAQAYMNDAVWIDSTPAAKPASRLTTPPDSARHGP